MIESLFILTPGGDVLLEKHWRVALSRTVVDVLLEEVRKHKVIEDVPPVIATGKHYLFSVFHRGLFYLAVTSGEVPPAHVIDFIHQLLRVLGTYLGQFTESHLAENFVTVYQLLEEMLDFGYPMLTEPNILTTLIRPPTVASRVVSFVTGKGSVGDTIGAGATSMIPWRKSDVTYTQNEITFDVIEEIDCIVGRNGQVVATDAFGKVRCNCKLSGTPDALLLFRETNFAADPAFHRCVRYSRWQKDKVLSFIPPDGQFQLMRYRVNTRSIEQPVYCRPQVSYADGHGRLTVAVGAKPIRVFAASTKVKPGAAGGAGGAAAALYGGDDGGSEDGTRKRRRFGSDEARKEGARERNRLNAHRSRMRKKLKAQNIESRLERLRMAVAFIPLALRQRVGVLLWPTVRAELGLPEVVDPRFAVPTVGPAYWPAP
uniref:MHD domain-containing protein n=1 Tax=Bicosoecida sp. CB-2014 TaxID=1486930 RepID=A0A7S1CHD6_9STRA|mmetsp:Transcript_24966/g.86983  ORF Transcript_24966/g.86983 Transcript_24966/m.86983 type:complete len:429 (+) Transcript_24966:223-1509(+)